MDNRPKIIVLGGPTGVGKTRASLALAETFGAQIVNADSMQVYRYMDIGTAKPTAEEQALARHHLVDVVSPDEDFDAARYLRLARPLIDELDRAGIPVIVVGGTGLYLRSLLKGLFQGPGKDERVRAGLVVEAEEKGLSELFARLVRVDPEAARRLHPHDRVRIIRALEVFELTGRTISEFQVEHGLREAPYQVLFYCLNLERETLYQRIEDRTRDMFEQGLADEVRGLMDRGYSPEIKPMKAIGYKQTVSYVTGHISLEEAIRETMKQTRRFAKRQLTWYRAQENLVWRRPDDLDALLEQAETFWKTSDAV